MKKYVVSVIDFEGGDIDLVVEGVYTNFCLAINSARKVLSDLVDNAKYNKKCKLSITNIFDKQYMLEKVLVGNEGNLLFQINISETFE